MPEYRATEYLRLSYSMDRENESDSITNQKKLIEDFLKGHPEIELVSEHVDDGYSGILFDRPQFQAMMQDIREGKINCVIVKDLSRLGREYIETGRYLRQIFPAYGVRFIAITDGVDTAHEGSGDDLNISLKTIMNDAYCHDISVKTRSALLVKRKSGDFVGACPIYGYRKSEENHNQLVVDSFAARIVQDIFRKRIDGYSAAKIAEELNRSGILSPLAYKESRGLPHPSGGFADKEKTKWSATTIIRILKDETYTGTLVQGRQTTYNHKVKNLVKKPFAEWIRTENAHEPIIRRQDYDLVQKIMVLDTRTAPNGDKVYLFSGILVCGCCGARMTRKTVPYKSGKYFYYYCPTGKKNGCTHPVMLREQDLTDCITESLKAHIRNVVSLEELLRDISEEQVNQQLVAEYKAQLMENEEQLATLTRFQSTLYENFVTGFLDKEEYKSLKNSYHTDIDHLKEAVSKLREEMDAVKGNSHDRLRWIQHFKRFSGIEELDRRAVIALIQSIRVLGKDDLQITFRYQMEYQAILERLSLHTTLSLPGQGVKGKEAV